MSDRTYGPAAVRRVARETAKFRRSAASPTSVMTPVRVARRRRPGAWDAGGDAGVGQMALARAMCIGMSQAVATPAVCAGSVADGDAGVWVAVTMPMPAMCAGGQMATM